MNFPVFDLHCDTALALRGKDLANPVSLAKNELHIDLDRASALPGYAQCFACFTTPFMQQWYGISPETVFQLEIDSIQTELERNRKKIRQAYTASDVKKHSQQGLFSAILTIEGPAGFGFDPELLPILYQAGFRMSTLGWNEENVLIGSHKTGGGLTDLGKAYLRSAQETGIIVDVSHSSDEGFWDIIRETKKPVIASHSNSRAVCDNSRNLTDDMFRAICQTGGVAGFNQCAPFVGMNPDLDTVCDHILHWLELDPDGRHIALGADLDGCDVLPDGFTGIESYPAMAQRLLARGVGEDIVRNIYWNNALGVMEVCCM